MTALLTLSITGSAMVAVILYKARSWSRRELLRILAFGSGTLLVSGLNLLVPSAGREPLFGAIAGFSFFFALENYAVVHSCPEYLEECSVHSMSGLTAMALTFHSLLDGVILGISAKLGPQEFWSVLVGMSIHKFADAMTMMALLESEMRLGYFIHLAIVLGVTLMTPLGAFLTHALPDPESVAWLLPSMTGFSAGCLLYIGASDILPRIHRLNDSPCFFYYLAGLASMVGLLKTFAH